jgi:hypothetical protein
MEPTNFNAIERIKLAWIFAFYLGGHFYEILSVIVISAGVNIWTSSPFKGASVEGLWLVASGVAFYFFAEEAKDYDARAREQQFIEKSGMKKYHMEKILLFDLEKRPLHLRLRIGLLIFALAAASIAFFRIADSGGQVPLPVVQDEKARIPEANPGELEVTPHPSPPPANSSRPGGVS